LTLAAAALATVGVSASAGATVFNGSGSIDDTTSTIQFEPLAASAPSGADVSGPCDEVEHVNDPRCLGEATSGTGGSSSDDHDSDDHDSDDHDSDDHDSDDHDSDDDDSDDDDSDDDDSDIGGESTDD
jgi:hypothetical protein